MATAVLACGNGEDGGPDAATIEPNLSSLQKNVFFPTCTFSSCHGSLSPAEGLDLSSEEATRRSLVGVQSARVDRLLVAPNAPEDSYLLEKLESDDPEAGERMPRSVAPLSPEVVDVIREWIRLGAP